MVEDFATVPRGSVYVAVVRDEASKKLSQEAKDIFNGMGSKEIDSLGFGEGYLFIGVKGGGARSKIERRGGSVQAGVALGYSRVTKKEKTVSKKLVSKAKSWKRTVRRVYTKVTTETKLVGTPPNQREVTTERRVTRVAKWVVTCRRTPKHLETDSNTRTTEHGGVRK